MKAHFPLEQRGRTARGEDFVARRRQISSHWTPAERGRRLLLATVLRAALWEQIGLR
jgi:hypothetical protein